MSVKFTSKGLADGTDDTKELEFNVTGVTTGTTRTITVPNGDTKLYTGDGTSGQILTSNGAGTAPTFQTSTHTPEGTAVLSTGEAGGTKFLREDGDGTCSWQEAGGGAWTLISNTSITATTNMDITGFDSSLYSTYKIIFNGIPYTNNVNLYMILSTNGGTTFDSGGTSYTNHGIHFNNVTSMNGGSGQTAYFQIYPSNDISNNSSGKDSAGIQFEALLYNMGSLLSKKLSFTGFMKYDGFFFGGGRTEDAADNTAANAVRFFYSSGSHKAVGSIQLLGLKL